MFSLSGLSDWMRLKFRRRKFGHDHPSEIIRKSRSDNREKYVSIDKNIAIGGYIDVAIGRGVCYNNSKAVLSYSMHVVGRVLKICF